MNEFYLEAKGISKSFGGVQALKQVDLRIKPGESVCLVGENGCGKSTLIKIISGTYSANAGEIIIDGVSYAQMTPLQSTRAGVQVIYQDFALFHNLTVAENIAMPVNLNTDHKGLFSRSANMQFAQQALKEIGVPIDPCAIVDDLPIAQRQIVAICRALVQDAKLLIMDEPTTALTNREVSALYKIINTLKSRGIALLFVSHKMDEVFRIAERIIVIRNGEKVIEGPVGDFDASSLTYYMTGKEPEFIPFDNPISAKDAIFSCTNLCAKDGAFKNVSFSLYRGEVLGITGLLGSGRESLAEALFGIHPHKADEMTLCGQPLSINRPSEAVRAGIGYIPEDRAQKGLYLKASIGDNIMSSVMFRYQRMGFLQRKRLHNVALEQSGNLHIKCAGIEAPAASLSGGNQQRVVIAKWLALHPKLIIFNCPTVGVDVGSKAEIHALAKSFAKDGIGVILISDDLPEILSACNRVLVMNHGEIRNQFNTAEIQEQTLYEEMIRE